MGQGSDNTADLREGRMEGKMPSETHRDRETSEFASTTSTQPALCIFTYTWVFSLLHGSTFVFAKTPDQTIIKPSATIPNLLPLPPQGNKRLKEAEPDF